MNLIWTSQEFFPPHLVQDNLVITNIYIIFFFTLPGPQAKDIYKIQAKNTRRKNTCSNTWKSELFHTHILIGAADLSRLKCAKIQGAKI